VRIPLVTITILGLALIAYGLLSLLRNNPVVRAEVMKRLSPDNQIRLTNLINKSHDLTGGYSRLKNIESLTETCTAPVEINGNCGHPINQKNSNSPQLNNAPNDSTVEKLMQLQKIEKKHNETLRALSQ